VPLPQLESAVYPLLLHVECRSGSPAVLFADKSRRRLKRPPSFCCHCIHPSLPYRCGAAHMPREIPHRNPRPVSQTRRPSAKHPARNHTHDTAHSLIPRLAGDASSALCHLFRMLCFLLELPLHPVFRMSDPISPRLLLPPWTPAHRLQNRRKILRCRAPENVQSRFGRHPTYQRHASSINRILPEPFVRYPSSFPQFPRIRNTTPVTHHPPKGRSGKPFPNRSGTVLLPLSIAPAAAYVTMKHATPRAEKSLHHQSASPSVLQ